MPDEYGCMNTQYVSLDPGTPYATTTGKHPRALTPKAILRIIRKAVDEWVERYDNEETIRENVYKQLDTEQQKVIERIADIHSGYYHNTVGNTATTKIEQAATEWIDVNLKAVINSVDGDIGQLIQKSYSTVYKEALKNELHKLAISRAKSDAHDLIEVTGYIDLDSLDRAEKDELSNNKIKPVIDRSHNWITKPIIGSVKCIGLVRLEGNKLLHGDPTNPDHKIYVILTLCAAIDHDIMVSIISNGDEWHPINGLIRYSGSIDKMPGNLTILDNFTSRSELIFNLMNEEDHKKISTAVNEYLTSLSPE